MLQTVTPYLLRVCRSVDALRRLVVLLVLATFVPALPAAATVAKRSYDIASGDAVTTLRLFAEQSGEQVIFVVPNVRGVTTNRVQGEFIAREVIERMLKNTPLMVLHDERSGAMTITRDRRGNTGTAVRPSTHSRMGSQVSESPDTPIKTNTTIKKMSPLAVLRAFLGLAVAVPIAGAGDGGAATGTITGRVQNVVTGQYLNNARVSIMGTTKTVYTDNFGVFQLVAVPSGPVILEVFYTDLDLEQIPLNVVTGGTITRDVNLTSVARYGKDARAVQLDAFVVTSDRETDAQAIATNEQRFAPNIKNVMSTDSLGDVLGSSVGEFLKFMPGITAEYESGDVRSISVRGIGGDMTAITVDGGPSSNIWVDTTRTVDIRAMALNDISRIELTKVPTPSTPADSLGGSVNMVSKSAFERSGMELRYGVNLLGNHENLTLKKVPYSYMDRKNYAVLPSFNFDFAWPVTRTFGLVLAGMSTSIFREEHFTRTVWANTGTGTNLSSASVSNPYLAQYLLRDGPRNTKRNTLSLKADWKVTRHSVLSLGHTINRADSRLGSLLMTFNAGNNGTPIPETGVAATFDPTFTRGATGRGSITNSGTSQLINQTADSTNLTYRYDNGRWKIETGLTRSASGTKARHASAGFFYDVLAANNRPIRINFLGIGADKPGAIEVYDNNDQPFEWRDLSNFRGTTNRNYTSYRRNQYNTGYINVRRRFDILPFPTALQVGGSQRVQTFDTQFTPEYFTFSGPDGVSGETAPLAPYAMQVYKDLDNGYGFHGIQWLSPMRAWRAYQLNPLLYSKTVAQQFAAANDFINSYELIKETVNATYIQAEAEFFKNRLRVLGGVRFEKTIDDGQGAFTDADAVWQRDLQGNYIRNAAGARIRKPEAGAVNSLEQVALTRKPRGAVANRTYDGHYPSLHITFSATENFLVRAAYASTYGRPNLSDIIPRTVATADDLDDDDPDPITGRGMLTIRNSTLKPWAADNFDLSAEYYTQQGGLFSAGVFLKEIRNFFGTSARIATQADIAALNIDPRYLGWNVVTKFNSGDAQIKGAEFNLKHSLRALGRWGSWFTVFANATKLELSGNPGASFTSFTPTSGNWGATFSRKRIVVSARWSYRGLEQRSPQAAFGPDGSQYSKARTMLDMTASYQLTRKLSLAASVNNVTNEPLTLLNYGSQTPAYARQFNSAEQGIALAVGLRGTF